VLALPEADEVPLQLADIPVLPLAPGVGTSARWVPDELPVSGSSSQSNIVASPELSLQQFGNSQVPASVPVSVSVAAPVPIKAPVSELNFSVPIASEPVKAIERIRRPGRRTNRGNAVLAVMALLVVGIAFAAYQLISGTQQMHSGQQAPAVNPGWEAEKEKLAESNESVKSLSPTSGKPITLDYLPFTPQLLCHLRPSELWKKDRTKGEFRAMLSALEVWLKGQILLRTRFEPEEISELTFAINFGPRMSKPEIAAVVRLREPETSLAKRFGASPADSFQGVFESPEVALLEIDSRTFIVAPASLSEELALSKTYPALASPGMEPLLQESDRDRHLTLLCDLRILDSHREDIFIEQMQKIVDKFIIRMGSQVETLSWSLHLEPQFFMETLLRNTTDSSVIKVQKHAQLELSRLPEDMLWAVKKMKPGTAGSRQIIGRFPAMLQAMDVGTSAHVAPTFARLVTLLPAKAAANLAAGVLLTWDQSLRTNFDEDTRLTSSETMKIPDKIADRLDMKVLIDFRNTPLQEAFAYIGESIKTEVTIDGKAFQGAGFTQVMSQTFDLGTVTARVALHAIISKYAKERDPMVLIVDEQGQKLILSTVAKATADGLTVFDTSPKP
jgi:hypothetical protein